VQQTVVPTAGPGFSTPVASLLGSVVLVGLWDEEKQQIRNVGSGFIVDKKYGLIVTAGHILLEMAEGSAFGEPKCGLKHAKAVIGVIVDDSNTAKFRYFAEIVAHDIANIDACVLRITTRMEDDVEGEGEDCVNQSQTSLVNNVEAIAAEKLLQLKMTRSFELEESVRILGFNQGGEGLLEEGKHVNRAVDFAKGYICKKFKAPWDDESSESSASTSFCPREEIVVMCPTISGHSGGPCVNDEGSVVGILSRADPVDKQRCYLVPSSELKVLVRVAKEACRLSMSKL
jgi:CBS domain-containing protein